MQLEYFQGGGIIGYQEKKTHLYIIPRNYEVQLEYFQGGGIIGFKRRKHIYTLYLGIQRCNLSIFSGVGKGYLVFQE